ncbi:MAG TPA: hypothetical protein VHU40_01515, partial [Polyangia bacterium]|nr:hypothetical protein [Polyangia bacterium]
AGVLAPPLSERLQAIAQALFYPDRNYEAVLGQARAEGLDPTSLAAFEQWLPSHKVDQKKTDARALLTALAARPEGARPAPTFSFQQTEAWHRLRATHTDAAPTAPARDAASPAVWNRAVLRAIAVRDARLHQARLAPGAVDAVVAAFRRERGLLTEETFVAWLSRHFANDAEAARFFVEEALVRALIDAHGPAAAGHLEHERIAAQDDDRLSR